MKIFIKYIMPLLALLFGFFGTQLVIQHFRTEKIDRVQRDIDLALLGWELHSVGASSNEVVKIVSCIHKR